MINNRSKYIKKKLIDSPAIHLSDRGRGFAARVTGDCKETLKNHLDHIDLPVHHNNKLISLNDSTATAIFVILICKAYSIAIDRYRPGRVITIFNQVFDSQASTKEIKRG